MKILLVGAGGYAAIYVKALLGNKDPEVQWVGIADPYYNVCALKEQIDAAKIPVYNTMEEFYSENTADLAIICTPTYLHCEQSICALSHGSYVLCEKPVAPTMESVEKMLAAEKQYGKFIAIGYQWSYSEAILALKRDILDGKLGKPLRFKTAISWPRNRAYYERGSGWGGRISKNGILLLDSIASNACAHYLHNMLFVLGDTMETAARAKLVAADCLQANDIENFDTCALRLTTKDNVSLYYIASHATEKKKNPEFVYAFENATVTFSQDEGSEIIATFRDGTTKNYGNPFASDTKKLWDSIAAAKSGNPPICTVRTAMEHTRLIETLYREVPIKRFPEEEIAIKEGTDYTYVKGLYERLYKAYEAEKLLSE